MKVMIKVELKTQRILLDDLNEEVKEKLRLIHLTNEKEIYPPQEHGKVNEYELSDVTLYFIKYPNIDMALIEELDWCGEESGGFIKQTFYPQHSINLDILYRYQTKEHFDQSNSYIVKRKKTDQVGYGIVFSHVEEDFYYIILEI